jgi:hypothetical protein
MIRLIYTSNATVPFDTAALDALLAESRRRNETAAITGMLLYREGEFLQVLEGDEGTVAATYQRILEDSRHEAITLLDRTEIVRREFGDWAMGFQRMTAGDLPSGFSDLFSGALDPDAVALPWSNAVHLLASFGRGVRAPRKP